tara:strand:- start:285 stop:518 length:234 start_codon:yes stop_codon:yes gene_type:complete
MNNKSCRDFGPLETVTIGQVDAMQLWPLRSARTGADRFKMGRVKVSVDNNAAPLKRGNSVHDLFGLSRGPSMKKKKG